MADADIVADTISRQADVLFTDALVTCGACPTCTEPFTFNRRACMNVRPDGSTDE